FGQTRVGGELNFVVRLGECQDFAGRRLGIMLAGMKLLERVVQVLAQLHDSEWITEVLQEMAAEVARQSEFTRLPAEQVSLVRRVRHLFRFPAMRRRVIDPDGAISSHGSCAKGDRRNVAFASGAQAQNKAQ